MNRRVVSAFCVLMVLVGMTATAGAATHFQKGMAAADKGDYKLALKEYGIAAKQGDADAQNNLGYMYQNAQGVTADNKTAAGYFKLAAEKGNPKAAYNLARIYESGAGVEQSDSEALKWFTVAARKGVVEAQRYLGIVYADGKLGVEPDPFKAYLLWGAAAKRGDEGAKKNQEKIAARLSDEQKQKAEQIIKMW